MDVMCLFRNRTIRQENYAKTDKETVLDKGFYFNVWTERKKKHVENRNKNIKSYIFFE